MREGPAQDQTRDPDRADPVEAEVYDALRRAAAAAMAGERAGHTLQPTALVNEVYLRLAEGRRKPWDSEAHYYAAAVQAMRRVLVDHARSRGAAKRGGPGRPRVSLDELHLAADENPSDFLILDDTIARLQSEAPEMAEVLTLRAFGGLDTAATARVLGVSEATTKRRLSYARAWIARELEAADRSRGR